ncbi:MAG: alanine:cation symporter family protein [Holosporales bacterium]|nr:alanine:cation symporter family protein [Holosporales bacterium]
MWSWPLIIFIMIIGIYFSFRLGILRFSALKLSMTSILHHEESEGDISVFASLCTALSSTIGTGNIVGIAVAISIGGPGALFWLWISSIFSLAIKYAEGLLSIKYRKIGRDGRVSGGPMYYIELGLKDHPVFAKILAKSFAIFGIIVTLLGTGTFAQSNSIAVALQSSFGIPIVLSAILIGLLTTLITFGGLSRIAAVSEKLVPLMAVFYVGAAILVLLLNISSIPHAFSMIFSGAFSTDSIFGGGIAHIVSVGVRRGIYSHESGLGSSAIASATAQTNSPARQGFVSMSGAIFSIIICTMTSLVLILTCDATGLFSGTCELKGAALTSCAFGHGLGIIHIGKYVVDIGISLFAFTTIIGWNYYGEKCTQYVFGDGWITAFKILYIACVAVGPFIGINTILLIADILTGFMALTNLIGVVKLRKDVIQETSDFWKSHLSL